MFRHQTIAIALVMAAAPALSQDFDAVEVTVHEVSGDVHYIKGEGGNIGMLAGPDGVFLVDDQYAPLTDKIVAAIRTVSDEPIRVVINTHLHPDHTGGNENFGRLGAMIVGHDNVRLQMQRLGYTQQPPAVTFSRDMTFNVNDEVIHVFKIPDAHTDGDSFIKFEKANVIHTGDTFRTTGYPYIDLRSGGSFLGTIRAHDLLIDISDVDTRILPGHGVVVGVNTVRETRDMLLTLRDRVQTAINEGMSVEEAQAAGLTEDFDSKYRPAGNFGTPEQLIAAAYADLAPSE
ncbi:MAG: MBL fold metallo-hydrolase [Woeseiaceae bacterium]|nr:MBL fold metallo-hydrolase [Woeseiaceae bacterium]